MPQHISRRVVRLALLILGAVALWADQPAFTTRVSLDSPVTISSFVESKIYGFESVLIQNDTPDVVTAVQLMVTFRTDLGEEIVADRRFQMEIPPRGSRRLIVDLGQKEGLRQKMKPGPESKALAILGVKSVEFADGHFWQTNLQITDPPLFNSR